MIQNMKDAGCDGELITKICRLYADGQIQGAVKILRRHRCSLMEQLHESQSKVDCLDFLVRQMEKSQRSSNKQILKFERRKCGERMEM